MLVEAIAKHLLQDKPHQRLGEIELTGVFVLCGKTVGRHDLPWF